MRSPSFSFGGANIKGTPAMKYAAVLNDVRRITKALDVLVVQEFKWRWYWTVIRSVLALTWRSAPGFTRGIKDPVFGAQAVFWRQSMFARVSTIVKPAFDFSERTYDIMGKRWIRAVQLREKSSLLHCWFVSMHAVVGGDSHDDENKREMFMRQNLSRLDDMIERLCRTDVPVIFEADMNIRPGTWSYKELMEIVRKHGGRIIGTHGIEYLIIFDRHCKTKVVVEKKYTMEPKKYKLNTDHEVRCITAYLTTD